jgi:hypothetical protein
VSNKKPLARPLSSSSAAMKIRAAWIAIYLLVLPQNCTERLQITEQGEIVDVHRDMPDVPA